MKRDLIIIGIIAASALINSILNGVMVERLLIRLAVLESHK